VGAHVSIDTRTKGVAGAAGQSPHGILQELLNRSSERLWGIVSNGLTLRILRDNASLTRQAYVEFDLEAIFTGEAYADFALLWHLVHRTRLEPRLADGAAEDATPAAHGCILERWSKVAEDSGARARDKLRDGVQEAIEALGSGFLRHPANGTLKRLLQSGELSTQDYYRELLRLVYRLILLFVAEDRDLLLDPKASAEARDRYGRYYSTTRLRRLAERRKGSRHADLYAGLRVIVAALGRDEGAPTVGLPPLGGFLFGPDACPHLDGTALANADLLDAIRNLATIEERGVRRLVDYRNLGAEELGSIYESLLELHPEIDTAAGAFRLASSAGHERKTTGSYYTPSSLISVLLDSALDPVLEEAVADAKTQNDKERAILAFSVVDPAAGSGHFLVAAAHRIAKRLAQVRTGDEEPAPEAVRTALRDVIGHCLYAVDINPMAVELCKVSLWLEALDPGKPLSFLDAHIKCGNSLLGTTPELVAQGIPDAAYAPIEGDVKAVASALKKRNHAEREGQQTLFEAPLAIPTDVLAAGARSVDDLPEDDPGAVAAKASRHAALAESTEYRRSRLVLDSWCASFVVRKAGDDPEITTGTLRMIASEPRRAPEAVALVERTAADYGFLHWPIEFPAVFAAGGFDVVIGNPPWERVKLQEKEFFAERSPAIAGARNAAERKRLIAGLERTDPPLWTAFRAAVRRSDGESHLLRNSGRYPLAGRGDINTYAVFAELMRLALNPRGRQGVILPTGIATDDTTKYFFGDLVEKRSLISLYSFENEEFVFPAVHHATKFCLLTLTGAINPEPVDLVFFLRQVANLSDQERHFSLTSEDFSLLNPNTRTCPTFRSGYDANLAKAIYGRVPVLINEAERDSGNPWGVSFLRMFDMANDSGLFLDAPGPGRLPLMEAKMVHQFDHRYGTYEGQTDSQRNQGTLPRPTLHDKQNADYSTRPRYWVEQRVVRERLGPRGDPQWLLGWRDICRATDERTAIVAALPRSGTGGIPLLIADSPLAGLLLAITNSFIVDWVARQKVGGTHLAIFIVEQLPIASPRQLCDSTPWAGVVADWVRRRVVELAFTSNDMRPMASSLGWAGPPFRWSDERRRVLRAELDAAAFHLYALDREAVDRVMESFWIVRQRDEAHQGTYRTRDLILDAFDRMAAASTTQPFVSKLDPPPGDPSAAHAPKSGEGHGSWIPWQEFQRQVGRISGGEAASAAPERAVAAAMRGPAPRREVSRLPERGTMADREVESHWLPEASFEATDIVSGQRVRHRSQGDGIVVTAKPTKSAAELLIRFENGRETWMVFGLGLLEFEA
jgi:type I restriction-modification system DNA methylase subunit